MRDIGARAESSAYEVKSTELTVADFLIMEAPPHMWRRPLTLQVGGVEVRNTSTYVDVKHKNLEKPWIKEFVDWYLQYDPVCSRAEWTYWYEYFGIDAACV